MNKNKVTVSCKDGVINEEFDKAYIYTNKYNIRLKKDSIHAPRAAKIILKNGNENTALLLFSPIVSVDYKGNVNIYTASSVDRTTLKKKTKFTSSSYKEYKINEKLFKAKIALGLSYSEIVERTNNEIELEVSELTKKLGSYKEGGGFDG